jgi:hypothetical protein
MKVIQDLKVAQAADKVNGGHTEAQNFSRQA